MNYCTPIYRHSFGHSWSERTQLNKRLSCEKCWAYYRYVDLNK